MVSNLVLENKKHVRWLRSVLPLDKKVFLLTTVSSSQKCSNLWEYFCSQIEGFGIRFLNSIQ